MRLVDLLLTSRPKATHVSANNNNNNMLVSPVPLSDYRDEIPLVRYPSLSALSRLLIAGQTANSQSVFVENSRSNNRSASGPFLNAFTTCESDSMKRERRRGSPPPVASPTVKKLTTEQDDIYIEHQSELLQRDLDVSLVFGRQADLCNYSLHSRFKEFMPNLDDEEVFSSSCIAENTVVDKMLNWHPMGGVVTSVVRRNSLLSTDGSDTSEVDKPQSRAVGRQMLLDSDGGSFESTTSSSLADDDWPFTDDCYQISAAEPKLMTSSNTAIWPSLQLDESGQYEIENLPLFNFNDVGLQFEPSSLLPACCESKKEKQELKQDVQEMSSFASFPTNSADIPSKMTGPYATTVQRDSQAASDEPKAVLEYTRPIPSYDCSARNFNDKDRPNFSVINSVLPTSSVQSSEVLKLLLKSRPSPIQSDSVSRLQSNQPTASAATDARKENGSMLKRTPRRLSQQSPGVDSASPYPIFNRISRARIQSSTSDAKIQPTRPAACLRDERQFDVKNCFDERLLVNKPGHGNRLIPEGCCPPRPQSTKHSLQSLETNNLSTPVYLNDELSVLVKHISSNHPLSRHNPPPNSNYCPPPQNCARGPPARHSNMIDELTKFAQRASAEWQWKRNEHGMKEGTNEEEQVDEKDEFNTDELIRNLFPADLVEFGNRPLNDSSFIKKEMDEAFMEAMTDHDYCQNIADDLLYCLSDESPSDDYSTRKSCENSTIRSLLLDKNLTEELRKQANEDRERNRRRMTEKPESKTFPSFAKVAEYGIFEDELNTRRSAELAESDFRNTVLEARDENVENQTTSFPAVGFVWPNCQHDIVQQTFSAVNTLGDLMMSYDLNSDFDDAIAFATTNQNNGDREPTFDLILSQDNLSSNVLSCNDGMQFDDDCFQCHDTIGAESIDYSHLDLFLDFGGDILSGSDMDRLGEDRHSSKRTLRRLRGVKCQPAGLCKSMQVKRGKLHKRKTHCFRFFSSPYLKRSRAKGFTKRFTRHRHNK